MTLRGSTKRWKWYSSTQPPRIVPLCESGPRTSSLCCRSLTLRFGSNCARKMQHGEQRRVEAEEEASAAIVPHAEMTMMTETERIEEGRTDRVAKQYCRS